MIETRFRTDNYHRLLFIGEELCRLLKEVTDITFEATQIQAQDLRSQNRDLLWQLQQVKQQQPPLRASTANDSEELQRQVTEPAAE